MYRYTAFIIFLLIAQVCKSQTDYPGNLYVYNKYLLNPAYTGYQNKLSLLLNYRSASLSTYGAPKQIAFGVHSPILKNMGIGVRIENRTEGLFNFFNGFIDYSYYVNLSSNQRLRFGISGGIKLNQLDNSSIIATNPSAVIEIASNHFTGSFFESSAGIVYQIESFELSFSSPRLFGTSKEFNPNFASWFSYHFKVLDEQIVLTPNIYTLYVPKTPLLYDINLMANWQQKFQLGIGYRNRPSFILNFGLVLTNLKINYAAEISIEKYANIFNTIHEISVSYQFKKNINIPSDSIYNPALELIVKNDSLNGDTILKNEVLSNIKQDTLTSISTYNDEMAYELTKVADGIFILKPQSKKDTDINDNQVDSLLNAGALFKLEEKNTNSNKGNYEIVEQCNGIYTIKSNDSINLAHEISDELVDSLIALNKFNLGNKNNLNPDNSSITKDSYSEYYTIQVFINNNSDVLLNDLELSEQLQAKKGKTGKISYFYGNYPSKKQAKEAEEYLIKKGVQKMKIISVHKKKVQNN